MFRFKDVLELELLLLQLQLLFHGRSQAKELPPTACVVRHSIAAIAIIATRVRRDLASRVVEDPPRGRDCAERRDANAHELQR